MSYYVKKDETLAIDTDVEVFDSDTVIGMHKHRFYEFAFLQKGTAIHHYHDVPLVLINGDLLLIPPENEHSYEIRGGTTIINCYFFPEQIHQLADYIVDGEYRPHRAPRSLYGIQEQWEDLMSTLSLRDIPERNESLSVEEKVRRQGVLHLPPQTMMHIENILLAMHQECRNRKPDSIYLTSAYLQILLTIFSRTAIHSTERLLVESDSKRQALLPILEMIEERFTDAITVQEMADTAHLSLTAFRKSFKEITGLSPNDYLNRFRITQSLRYIQYEGLPIAEAAEKVGIHDANYFTRLFRKLLGYAPSYFRKID